MNKKRILVSGASGDFGKSMIKCFDNTKFDIFYASKSQMDVTSIKQIERVVDDFNPDYFIHAAALTRPMIYHETHPSKSILNNIVGTSNVTAVCCNKKIKLIYLSTDHVYKGDAGNYSEDDELFPVNSYGWSKLGGECAVQIYEHSCILRLAMVKYPFPHNKAIVDSYKSSIFIDDVVKILDKFLDKKGVFNIGKERSSIYDFAKKSNNNIEKILLKNIKSVNMPKDSSMNLKKMKEVLEND